MSGNNSESDPIGRLVDMLVQDLLDTPDEELLKEIKDRGDDPRAIADRMRALFGKAEAVDGRQRLLAARVAVNADAERRAAHSTHDPVAARQRLNSIMNRFPNATAKLTMAARKGKGMSDNDVLSLLADLEDLGITGEGGE